MDTIVALSSGAPPAAIGVVRVSGPLASKSLETLCGRLPIARRATLMTLRNGLREPIDSALTLWFPGPHTATGEDCAEFHCHGGRAVVAAVIGSLVAISGIREAQAGEFTRRAFANGRMDLSEAEGLADLLSAETELQRATAMACASGAISQKVSEWRDAVLKLSAQVEAALDFSDEEDATELPSGFSDNLAGLGEDLRSWLNRPRSEKLGEGYRVALAGPPNAGKSTLFNALVESEAAITSPLAGTTRDIIERAVAIDGVPFTFVDTAGLRTDSDDSIELIGIDRARNELLQADTVLWLGPEGEGPSEALEIAPRTDVPEFVEKGRGSISLSAATGEGVDALKQVLLGLAKERLPKPGEASLNARQHGLVSEAEAALSQAQSLPDLLLVAEELRAARSSFDRLIGRSTTEDMLDALFGRFCIGK